MRAEKVAVAEVVPKTLSQLPGEFLAVEGAVQKARTAQAVLELRGGLEV